MSTRRKRSKQNPSVRKGIDTPNSKYHLFLTELGYDPLDFILINKSIDNLKFCQVSTRRTLDIRIWRGVRQLLKASLEGRVGKLSDAEFETVMEMTTDDLKFNRVSFGKSTNLNYVLDIAVRSAEIFKRCS